MLLRKLVAGTGVCSDCVVSLTVDVVNLNRCGAGCRHMPTATASRHKLAAIYAVREGVHRRCFGALLSRSGLLSAADIMCAEDHNSTFKQLWR